MNRLCPGLVLLAIAAFAADVPKSRFTLRVRSADPVRYYLTGEGGKPWTPEGAVVYDRGPEHHFVTRQGFDIELPPGRYALAAERGPEYRTFATTVEGTAGTDVTVTVALQRWIAMNKRGWYSGDLHNHRRPEDMPLLLLAEDLNLAPTLSDWVWEDRERGVPVQTGDPIRQVNATHAFSVLDKEVERLRNGPGAVDLLGLRTRIPFDGYLLYPPNDVYARQAHAQGGWVDAEKIVWRDAAALVALGHVDFAGIVHNHFNRHGVELETDSWGMIPKWLPEFRTAAGMPLWAMEVYYRFLNCGFRLPVSAGSASGVKAAPLGYNRVYVRTDGPFSYDAWFRSLKAGRSFATNGPMLLLSVDGQEPGSTISVPKEHRRSVRVRAEVTSQQPMDRLEVIFKGRTIRTARGTGRLTLDFAYDLEESGWFAARAFERPDRTVRFAHTSPVYIDVSGRSGIVPDDARFFLDWIDREIAFYRDLPGFRDPAHREAMLTLFTSARKVYAALADERARAVDR